jgi:hypothetical protein
MFALYHPYANAFHAAGVYVAGILYGHLGIRGVEGACVFVVETSFATYEYLPEGPFLGGVVIGDVCCGASGGFFIAVVAVAVEAS